MRDETIFLLVEDNPDDELFTRRTLKKSNVCNQLRVARDGVEALEYLFGTGTHTGRDLAVMPQMMMLNLDLPNIDGLEVLSRVRSDERTRRLPVMVLTSLEDQEGLVDEYGFEAYTCARKPLDLARFLLATRELGLYWVMLDGPPRG